MNPNKAKMITTVIRRVPTTLTKKTTTEAKQSFYEFKKPCFLSLSFNSFLTQFFFYDTLTDCLF